MSRELPLWARSLNEIADSLGGIEAVVDLRPESLLAAGGFSYAPTHLEPLAESLRREASLHTVGAIMARAELVRALKFRRWLDDDAAELIHGVPSGTGTAFVVGMARSGTSFVLRTLAQDERFIVPRTFEVLIPGVVGAADTERYAASATVQDELWNLMDPQFPSIHLNRGDLPAECLPVQSASMLSHHWTGCYRVPTYETLVDTDISLDAFRTHRRYRDRLAATRPGAVPLFKSPAYVRQLDRLIPHYPDGKFVLCIRDLDAAVASHAHLLTTIRGMRSTDSSILETSRQDAVNYFRHAVRRLSSMLDAGLIGRTNFRAIFYNDAVQSPVHQFKVLTTWLLADSNPLGRRFDPPSHAINFARQEKGEADPAVRFEIPQDVRMRFDELVSLLCEGELVLR